MANRSRGKETAEQATKKRENEIRSLFDEIISMYKPGGSYGAGTEAMLGREKQKYLGSAMQNLISSGMYGSTMTAAMPKKFEEEVGMPTRAKLEDLRYDRLASALGQKASFVERIEDQTPSYELMAGLQQQASAQPQQSLEDWLYGTFQGGGRAASPTTRTIQQPTRQMGITKPYQAPTTATPTPQPTPAPTPTYTPATQTYAPIYYNTQAKEQQLKKAVTKAEEDITKSLYSGLNFDNLFKAF